MARPAKNAEGPSARGRKQEAFWDCLAEGPLAAITVRDITSRAGVNRNSYYYHYENMMELAEEAIRGSVACDLAHALLENEASATPLSDAAGVDAAAQLARLRLVVGPNGDQSLVDATKRVIVGEWLGMYGLREKDLSEDALTALDYVFGGLSTLWACERFESVIDMLSAIAKSRLITHDIEVLRQGLAECARRVGETRAAEAQPGEDADPQVQIALF